MVRKRRTTKQNRPGGGVNLVLMLGLLFFMTGAVTCLTVPARADESQETTHLVERARFTLETFATAPEMEGFRSLVTRARGIFIAPQLIKGAFFVGASGGSGIFVARNPETGSWSGPAFYTIGGASFGFQFGGSASEVVLLAMTQRGVDSLLASSVKLGADVGVAAGPVGIGAAASTANWSADIVTFARSKGLYAGISLDGAIVKIRSDWNDAYYGAHVTPADILMRNRVANPHATPLIQAVSRLTQTKQPEETERREKQVDTGRQGGHGP